MSPALRPSSPVWCAPACACWCSATATVPGTPTPRSLCCATSRSCVSSSLNATADAASHRRRAGGRRAEAADADGVVVHVDVVGADHHHVEDVAADLGGGAGVG